MDINSLIMGWAKKSTDNEKLPKAQKPQSPVENRNDEVEVQKATKTKRNKKKAARVNEEVQTPKAESEPIHEQAADVGEPIHEQAADVEEPPPAPPKRMGSKIFKCGHMNFEYHGIEEDDPKQVEARDKEFCCVANQEAQDRYKALNPLNSTPRSLIQVFWGVKGLYEPVPIKMRRSPEKEEGPGWPGMCCHQKTGLYIGGIGNDCRYYSGGEDRCVVHSPKDKRVKSTKEG